MNSNGKNGAHDKTDPVVFEANMNAAERSHFRRTGAEALDNRTPFHVLASFEEAAQGMDDGTGERIGEYELRYMAAGYRLAFDRSLERGGTLLQVVRQWFALGRQIKHPFYSSLTVTEMGLLFSQTKAAFSWLLKQLSGELKLAGAKGYCMPGQKKPESSAAYAIAATGNSNRSRKAKVESRKARQGSFLRKFNPNHKPKQGSFLRKLTKTKPATDGHG